MMTRSHEFTKTFQSRQTKVAEAHLVATETTR
jgi:hypothetical protein